MKLTELDVLSISHARKLGATYQELADRWEVDKRTITAIFDGKNWKQTMQFPKEELDDSSHIPLREALCGTRPRCFVFFDESHYY